MECVIPRHDGGDDSQRLVHDPGDLVSENEVGAAPNSSWSAGEPTGAKESHSRSILGLEDLLAVRNDPSELLASCEDFAERSIDHFEVIDGSQRMLHSSKKRNGAIGGLHRPRGGPHFSPRRRQNVLTGLSSVSRRDSSDRFHVANTPIQQRLHHPASSVPITLVPALLREFRLRDEGADLLGRVSGQGLEMVTGRRGVGCDVRRSLRAR